MSFQPPDLSYAEAVCGIIGTLVALGAWHHQTRGPNDLRELLKVVNKAAKAIETKNQQPTDRQVVERLRRALKNFAVHSFFGEGTDSEAALRLTEGTAFFGAIPQSTASSPMGWLFRLTSRLGEGVAPVDVVHEVREITRRYLRSPSPLPDLRIVVLSPTGSAYGIASSLDDQIREAILHECSKAKEAPETKAKYANAHIVNDMAGKLQFTIQTVASLARFFDRTSVNDFARKYEPSNHG